MTPTTPVGILPAIPASIGRIASGHPGLARASIGHSAGALIAGSRVTAFLRPRASSPSVCFDGHRVVDAVRSELGQVANAVTSPGLLRREWIGPSGIVTESILAAPTLPLLWMQWHATGGADSQAIILELDPAALSQKEAVRERTESAVLLRGHDEGRSIAAYSVGGGRVSFEPGSRPILRLTPDSISEDGLTLVLAVGSDAELKGALKASAHAPAHAVRATATPGDDGISLRTGVEEIDDGVHWARWRLAGMVGGLRGRESVEPAYAMILGLGALGAGDGELARLALRELPTGSDEHAVLAGRLAAVLGDSSSAAACADSFLHGYAGSTPGLRALAARSLADGLRYAAPEALIAELRAFAATATRRDVGAGRRTLPVVARQSSAPSQPPYARWLEKLLTGDPWAGSSAAVLTDTFSELRHAAGLFMADPDSGWSVWRGVLARGMEGGPAGIGTWDPFDDPSPEEAEGRHPSGPSATAVLILALTQGLLGLAPDAPVGRIRMAPRIPGHVRRFTVSGIPVGDARLRLDYEREGSLLRYTVTPEVAPVPPLLVLEPSIAGRVASTLVDGASADLELRTAHARTVVPVQIPVDGPRVLEVRLAD